jgi:hypothetical protein
MSIFLQNAHLQFALHPERACWDLTSRASHSAALRGARLNVRYRPAGWPGQALSHGYALESWEPRQLSEPRTVQSPHGPLQQVTLLAGPYNLGLPHHYSSPCRLSTPSSRCRPTSPIAAPHPD